MKIKIKGYHGTSKSQALSIEKNGFNISKGDREWLGDGAYFFIKGLSKTPEKQAENWAIAQSWDKATHKNSYTNYSVLESNIEVEDDNFLDLTTSDGVEILDYIIKCHESKMKEIDVKIHYIDGFVINFARKEGLIPVEVSKGNFYIKFTS